MLITVGIMRIIVVIMAIMPRQRLRPLRLQLRPRQRLALPRLRPRQLLALRLRRRRKRELETIDKKGIPVGVPFFIAAGTGDRPRRTSIDQKVTTTFSDSGFCA